MTETFRARIYTGQPMTRALAMHYACSRAGLGGECTRRWPQSYLARTWSRTAGTSPWTPTRADLGYSTHYLANPVIERAPNPVLQQLQPCIDLLA